MRRFFPIPALSIPPGSRTPVTKYSASRRYRFCGARSAESVHAHLSWYAVYLANSWTWRCALTRVFSWVCAHSVGGYTDGAAHRNRCHVLLPMRGVKCPPQLREDVRDAEVCRAKMGKELRQTTHETARRESRCRPPVPSSRSQRTRASPKISNCQLSNGLRVDRERDGPFDGIR